MTPEAQRIAIAEACGWRIVQKTKYKWVASVPEPSALAILLVGLLALVGRRNRP
jgi:hypothetical protein